jgi:hypothetical protein
METKNELLKNLKIELETGVIPRNEIDIVMYNRIHSFFDNLEKIFDFSSEEDKESIAAMIYNNVDYYLDGKGEMWASIDIYDRNIICLYYAMADYHLNGRIPKDLFQNNYFGESNREEFQEFKIGAHKFLKLKK